jgi:hypothetical protein
VALQLGGQRQQRVVVEHLGAAEHERPGRGEPGHDRGRGRAEAAAVRDPVRADHLEPAGLAAERLEAGVQGAYDQVPASARDAVRALPGHVDEQTLVGDPDDDVVVHAQGQAERVEAGAEVGAGRGNPHAHRGGPERHPGCPSHPSRHC